MTAVIDWHRWGCQGHGFVGVGWLSPANVQLDITEEIGDEQSWVSFNGLLMEDKGRNRLLRLLGRARQWGTVNDGLGRKERSERRGGRGGQRERVEEMKNAACVSRYKISLML